MFYIGSRTAKIDSFDIELVGLDRGIEGAYRVASEFMMNGRVDIRAFTMQSGMLSGEPMISYWPRQSLDLGQTGSKNAHDRLLPTCRQP